MPGPDPTRTTRFKWEDIIMKENYRPYLETVSSVLGETGSQETGLAAAEAAARLEKEGLTSLSKPRRGAQCSDSSTR